MIVNIVFSKKCRVGEKVLKRQVSANRLNFVVGLRYNVYIRIMEVQLK